MVACRTSEIVGSIPHAVRPAFKTVVKLETRGGHCQLQIIIKRYEEQQGQGEVQHEGLEPMIKNWLAPILT